MNKKKFPEGFFTKDRPIAKPKYLNAEDMLNNYEADCEVYENSGDLLDTELWMIDYLKNHSSADVQPVIHCKDCAHYHTKQGSVNVYNKTDSYCDLHKEEKNTANDYCSHGKKLKKEENKNEKI